jgi:hypothetical protein
MLSRMATRPLVLLMGMMILTFPFLYTGDAPYSACAMRQQNACHGVNEWEPNKRMSAQRPFVAAGFVDAEERF